MLGARWEAFTVFLEGDYYLFSFLLLTVKLMNDFLDCPLAFSTEANLYYGFLLVGWVGLSLVCAIISSLCNLFSSLYYWSSVPIYLRIKRASTRWIEFLLKSGSLLLRLISFKVWLDFRFDCSSYTLETALRQASISLLMP